VLLIQRCPLIYYAYAGFPVFFWEEVLANRETIQQGINTLTQRDGKRVSSFTVTSESILYLCILESIVLDFEAVLM
jgi:GPI ethanolamine phosphate transferase 1